MPTERRLTKVEMRHTAFCATSKNVLDESKPDTLCAYTKVNIPEYSRHYITYITSFHDA